MGIKNKMKSFLALILALGLVLSSNAIPTQAAAKKGSIKSIKITNLPANTLTLKKGKSKKLKAKVEKTGKISKTVIWKSSNKKVAVVNTKGVVKAKKKGKVKIYAISKANKKKKATVVVTVGTPVTKVSLKTPKVTLNVGQM